MSSSAPRPRASASRASRSLSTSPSTSTATSAERAPLFGPAPLVFLVGNGGVGKTTCAAAAALAEARAGRRALVVSIDPAHSLGDALDASLGPEPAAVVVAGAALRSCELWACELDAERTYARWLAERRDAVRAALVRGTWFDEAELERVLDLAPPGLDELTALVELERFAASGAYDRIVVDPPPRGHLARLVGAPDVLARLAESLGALNAKHRVLARSLVGADLPDEVAAAVDELARAAARLAAWVRDPARCAFVWVTTPEPPSVAGTLAGAAELEALGARTSAVVLQRDVAAARGACAACRGRASASRELEAELRARLGPVPILRVPELDREPRGAELAAVADALERPPRARRPAARASASEPRAARRARAPRAAGWLVALAPPALRLLVVAGKGGVGKSTCATALALELARARPKRRVLLLSVDPAHALGAVLDAPLGDDERAIAAGAATLAARELDAARAFELRRARWRALVDGAFDGRLGASLDARLDREALGRLVELAPPGLDELGALLALVDELRLEDDAPADGLVVLDTPATGHALELLELPERALAWVHAALRLLLAQPSELRPRAIAEELVGAGRTLRALLGLLRDPERARCVAVTRAAELPRRETVRLAQGLERLGVALAAVLVNGSASDASGSASACPRCRRAARAQAGDLEALARSLPPRARRGSVTILAPEAFPAPRGADSLAAWARTWRLAEPAPQGRAS